MPPKKEKDVVQEVKIVDKAGKDAKKPAAGDAPPDKKKKKTVDVATAPPTKDVKTGTGKSVADVFQEPILPPSQSQIALANAEARARARQERVRRWPEVTKVKINTRPWQPPAPPQRLPPIEIELPELKTKRWVPPYKRKRLPRPRLQRIPPEEINKDLYECKQLTKVFHNFKVVDTNKMMLQGSLGCNSKKYSATYCAAQTGCIAMVARALLDDKAPDQLTRRDVDDIIETGDRYYKNCMLGLKCYKGNPKLQLCQMLPWFFFKDIKYTIKADQEDTGVLAKSPDSNQDAPDLMALMEKKTGSTYSGILSVGPDLHFFIFGHPPEPGSGSCRTICYIFDPHKLNDVGQPEPVQVVPCGGACVCGPPVGKGLGGGGFLRYPGITSFVIDFLSNYGDLNAATRGLPKPTVTLTNVEILQKDRLVREPTYEIDLRSLSAHCRAMWEELNKNYLLDRKRKHGEYPFGSLSAVSLAASRRKKKDKMSEFYQKPPKDEPPALPVPPEKSPPLLTNEQIMAKRGENFFLYAPKEDQHAFGRDDMIPQPPSQTFLHSPIDVAEGNFHSQFKEIPLPESYGEMPPEVGPLGIQGSGPGKMGEPGKDGKDPAGGQGSGPTGPPGSGDKDNDKDKDSKALANYKKQGSYWVLRGTRHFASFRYQLFKTYTGIPCCVTALTMLRRYPARAWNEDILDDTLDLGWNLYRESVMIKGGPIRRIVLGEIKERFVMKDTEYTIKTRGIVVWGRLNSTIPKVLDACRGIEQFFRESDAGILQVPGEYETAIWNEAGKYYMYHPWPADKEGCRVGLQDGGKACLIAFSSMTHLCNHFLDQTLYMRKKPFSIAEVYVFEQPTILPDPVNNMKPIKDNRWIVHGTFHEADDRFPEEHRGKQATPIVMVAIALAHLIEPTNWRPEDVDEALMRGDALYARTMDHLERMGISFDTPKGEEAAAEEEVDQTPTGTLAAADVMPRFKVSDYDCIEVDVIDGVYNGIIHGDPETGLLSLKESLRQMFLRNNHAVVTARGGSVAVWKADDHYYLFDPHGCDDNGYPTDDIRARACLVRLNGSIEELAELIDNQLPPGPDDSFNLTPVFVVATKFNPVLNAPEMQKDNKAFDWIAKRTAAILMGPMGENASLGKACDRAGVPHEDMAGKTIGLPAAAAFCCETENIPPFYMHQDHMFNFLETGAEYYNKFLLKTGRKVLYPEDLTDKFEMGANTFTIELGESTRLPFRLPDAPAEGGGGEEEEEGGEAEEFLGEPPPKHMIDLLNKYWNDYSKPAHTFLLVGDYHQLGVWLVPGGKCVVFDPSPTLDRGLLTPQRIKKGDELRLQRIKDETPQEGEGGGDEDEVGEEGGEALPEPEPEFVPPESCTALMVSACPQEMIDKLVQQAPLDQKQRIAPYWLYPVTVVNELTTTLKDRKQPKEGEGEEAAAEEEGEQLVDPLEDSALGQYFTRMGRTLASVRGKLCQSGKFFLDPPNRDHQDSANCVMGIVVESIEPYIYWKPSLIDAILKYGDRLYSFSLPKAAKPPLLAPKEVVPEFTVTSFTVKLTITPDVVVGDYKAGDTGAVLNLQRGIAAFFEGGNKYGILCCKNFCVAIWQVGGEPKAYLVFDPHCTGPNGKTSPGGGAAVVLFASLDDLVNTYKHNVDLLEKAGSNNFAIASVKVNWELTRNPPPVMPPGVTPDEGYEWKVLTAFVEFGKGKSILRGSRPIDLPRFTRRSLIQSSCAAVVAACLSQIRKPHLWTRRTVDQVMKVAGPLFDKSVGSLGYEFRPGEEILWPMQVYRRFILGVNYVKYDMDQLYCGKLEQFKPPGITVKYALETFFENHKVGLLWSQPYAVALWKTEGGPMYYMMEPHACGPTGLRSRDGASEGAACVLCFTSSKMVAQHYLQNIPGMDRIKHDFCLYVMNVNVFPIKHPQGEPGLIKQPADAGKYPKYVPATSKVDICGFPRRSDEKDRKPPGHETKCIDVQRATVMRDKKDPTLKGQRTPSGWLIMGDGTMYLSANHSMACGKYGSGSKGNQALACCMIAVAMSRVEDVCKWCSITLDQILDCGDQLYQDSYLHFRPKGTTLLNIEQVLRKFYIPGNCACRVVVFQPRQQGKVDENLLDEVTEFLREEKCGVFVAGKGDFAVALFSTPRGFYMFDPADRDRYGRAVAPPCIGNARACFSAYPNVESLASKLAANVPPADGPDGSTPADFKIYGMAFTGLRKMNAKD